MKLNKYKYAIVINLNKLIEKNIRKSWQIIDSKLGINFISSRSNSPHITLVSNLNFKKIIIKKVNSFLSNKIKPFNIYSNGLGVFFSDSPVVYLRWNINFELLKLKNNLEKIFNTKQKNYSGLNWIPKSTIAYKNFDEKDLSKILLLIKKINFKKKMEVKSISVISYHEKYGEKKIYEFNF